MNPSPLEQAIARDASSTWLNDVDVSTLEVCDMAAVDRRMLLGLVKQMEADAKWGAHNGGAHTLIKMHHADAMRLYAALKLVRPNHPLVDEYRQAYCEIARSSNAGQRAMEQSK